MFENQSNSDTSWPFNIKVQQAGYETLSVLHTEQMLKLKILLYVAACLKQLIKIKTTGKKETANGTILINYYYMYSL